MRDLDLNLGVTENIKSMGLEPGVSDINFKVISADEHWAGHLDIPIGTQVVDLWRTRTANGKPVVVTARGSDVNLIPSNRVARRQIVWAARRSSAVITAPVSSGRWTSPTSCVSSPSWMSRTLPFSIDNTVTARRRNGGSITTPFSSG